MKQLKKAPILFALCTVVFFSECKKEDKPEQLPPITTTGAMTFGCKVNDEVFVPRDGRGKPGLYVEYVDLGSGPGGGWYLNIPAVNWIPQSIPTVSITTDSLLVEEGKTYEFKNTKGNAKAFYVSGYDYYQKLDDNDSGSLAITRFDATNRIISGTFFFSCTNQTTGKTIHITDGRFDIRY